MLSLKVVIGIVAMSHGLVLAMVFLFLRQGNRQLNRLFVALMVITSVDAAFSVYFNSLTFLSWPHLIRVNSPLNYMHGPLLFLYACALTRPHFQFSPKHLWHFLPVLLRAAWSFDFYLQPGSEKIAWLELMRTDMPLESYVLGGLWQLQRLIYTVAAIHLILKYKRRQRPWWHLAFVTLFTLSWVAAFNRYLALMGVSYTLPSITQTLFVYGIAYLGLIRPKWINQAEASQAKYATSGLSEERVNDLFTKLQAYLVKEKPYLENGLTLTKLAKRLGVKTQHLSQVINQCTGQSFNDFINGHRVETFKRLAPLPENQHLTLEALAEEAGFNSTSTFNAAFRKATGTTPSQYRKACQMPDSPLESA